MANGELRILKTEADYNAAVARLDELVHQTETDGTGTEEMEVLGLLIESYEAERFPLSEPHPIDAIRFMMEQRGMTDADLGNVIGSRSRASEILNLKRGLSIDMIRAIHQQMHIPAEVLIQDYQLARA
ncbi:MAG: transcriptional regulator [Flavobacteriales bacterium]|nr:transcriptional regulator [Flavobacteriales bacterium]